MRFIGMIFNVSSKEEDLYDGRLRTRRILWFEGYDWGWFMSLYSMKLWGDQRGKMGGIIRRSVYVQAAADAGFRVMTNVLDSISGDDGSMNRLNTYGHRSVEVIETHQENKIEILDEAFSVANITEELSQSAEGSDSKVEREGLIILTASIPLLLS